MMYTSMVQKDLFGQQMIGFCRVCGRPLSDPRSVAAGIGPICNGGYIAKNGGDDVSEGENRDVLIDEPDFIDRVVLRRKPDWEDDAVGVITNIPVRVVQHSPSGYEWGYGGSGPADLALNILENYLLRMGYDGPRLECWRGDCFMLVYHLHQDFKFEFIAAVEREGGDIDGAAILEWINARRIDRILSTPIVDVHDFDQRL